MLVSRFSSWFVARFQVSLLFSHRPWNHLSTYVTYEKLTQDLEC